MILLEFGFQFVHVDSLVVQISFNHTIPHWVIFLAPLTATFVGFSHCLPSFIE
jgi:hypothetical protein